MRPASKSEASPANYANPNKGPLLGFVKKLKKFEFPAKFEIGPQDPLEGLSQLKSVPP